MSAISVMPPFPIFNDTSGLPLQSGFVYVGVAGMNAEANPIPVFWDSALTIPALQPLRTSGGYVSRNGSPAEIYADAVNCSLLVKNKNNALVWSSLSVSGISPDASGISYVPAGTGAVSTTVQEQFRKGVVRVDNFGTVGDGVADDLAAIELARDYAASVGKLLYFPKAVYGVSDRFMFADGGNTYFEPGATIKALNSTASGGVTSGPYPVQTKPLEVHNLTVDCNNIAGENAGGFGHIIGMKLFNYTAKNVKHSPIIFGGKALQFEGAETTNVQVIGVNLENCTIGLDFGAVATEQSVQIVVSNVVMKNVDVPIYVNDTNTSTPSDNYDQMDIVVSDVNLRNCGKLTYSGATSTGGGIIVSDRGYKLTVNDLKIINDRGGYTSTAYGGIGALVRGQGQGIILNNVLIDADLVALFDFNPALIQSPFVGDIASYVLADKVRHYGNLDYVVKCMPGGGKMGAGKMIGIEVGSTAASLAGVVDANAGAYSNTVLEVIDRDNQFKSTGLIYLSKIFSLGNTLDGGTVGYPAPSQLEGPWTPIDASGAGLTFAAATGWWVRQGNMVTLFGQVTYPATASGIAAVIGGFPFAVKDALYARSGGVLTLSSSATARRLYPASNGTTAPILNDASAPISNAACSGSILGFQITYPV